VQISLRKRGRGKNKHLISIEKKVYPGKRSFGIKGNFLVVQDRRCVTILVDQKLGGEEGGCHMIRHAVLQVASCFLVVMLHRHIVFELFVLCFVVLCPVLSCRTLDKFWTNDQFSFFSFPFPPCMHMVACMSYIPITHLSPQATMHPTMLKILYVFY
jgi:hypothetical protein